MADRFPSIEDLDEGQLAGGDNGDLLAGGGDDFLARERAALGDDAQQFATAQDNIAAGTDDLIGGTDTLANGASADELSQFQSQFPAVDTRNNRMAPGGTITGSQSPFLPGAVRAPPSQPFAPSPYEQGEEPTVIKEWRERRQLEIQKREEIAESRKAETVKAAQESIDDFYNNYNDKKERSIKQTRKDAEDFMAKREDTTSGGTSWERIAKLVDVRGGKAPAGSATGKERFRKLLGDLSKDENAPGAKGYSS